MKTKTVEKRGWMIFAILPVLLIFCAGIWIMQRATPIINVYSEDGVYDLHEFDFSQAMAELTRTVEYIPGELLSPEEFAARDDIQTGKVPDGTRVATMRVRLLVPDHQLYGLCGYFPNFADRIYVNGKWLHDEGSPGRNAGEEKAIETYHFFTAQPEDGVIELCIQTSSFVHKDTSSGIAMNVGDYKICRTHYLRSMASTMVIVALYLLMALIFLSFFIVTPEYKGNGWLALMSVTWAIRTGVMGNKPFLVLFPFLDWTVSYHIEKASAPTALIFLMLALHAAFPGAFPAWFRRMAACIATGLIALALLLPTRLYSNYSSDLMQAIYLVTLAMVVMILWSLKKKKPSQPQAIILAGMGLLVAAYAWDLIYYYAGFTWPVIPLLPAMVLIFSLLMLEAAMLHTIQEVAIAHEREHLAESESKMLAEMNRLKSAFYTDMSHEMKTPLTVIAVNAQFAAQNIEAGMVDEETVTDLNAISAEARRLAQMVTSLVGIGRMQDSGCRQLSLTSLLTETVRIYQPLFARRENSLVLEADQSLPAVEGNADQLIQVLINLLSNANRHTRAGTVVIRAEGLKGMVEVSVTDDGEGISPDLLPLVFDRFCHGENGGSGLGLSICKTIIEEHGGEIHIKSEKGRGTKVWFILPVKEETDHEGDRNDSFGGGR